MKIDESRWKNVSTCIGLWGILVGMMLLLGGACSSKRCISDSDCKVAQARCVQNVCVDPKPGAENNTDQEPSSVDGGIPQCPSKCKKDRDCVFCGSRKTCDSEQKRCVDIRTACPSVCNRDSDCSRAGCGGRTTCNVAIHTCVERVRACPDTCQEDLDCSVGGCGARSQCSTKFKTCVDPVFANCKFTCESNADCSQCGPRNQCQLHHPSAQKGTCRTLAQRACPSFCNSSADCFTSGCGERTFCNYALGTCVKSDQLCPWRCTKNSDCASNCGNRTYCYFSKPDSSGYCVQPPKTKTTCPDSCGTSFDCKQTSCGKRVFCSQVSKRCSVAEEVCPASCTTDQDCAKERCGKQTRCRRGFCRFPSP